MYPLYDPKSKSTQTQTKQRYTCTQTHLYFNYTMMSSPEIGTNTQNRLGLRVYVEIYIAGVCEISKTSDVSTVVLQA